MHVDSRRVGRDDQVAILGQRWIPMDRLEIIENAAIIPLMERIERPIALGSGSPWDLMRNKRIKI